MSFDYDKLKRKQENSEQWASYSDLFMVLSFVFLLLYVVASLRSGTFSIQKQLEHKKMTEKAEDLEKQIQVYNRIRQNYLEEQASTSEKDVYKELMGKLTLLQGEAKQEKEDLRQQATENEKKEMALNKYQQLVRNIINTNLLASARIKRRDDVIVEKKEVIEELNQEVEEKQQTIEQNEQKISQINQDLKKQMKDLERQRKRSKISKAKFKQKMASIQKQSKEKIEKIEQENQVVAQNLNQVQQKLQEVDQKLAQAENTIEQTTQEKVEVESKLASAKGELNQKLAELSETTQELQQTSQELEKKGQEKEKLAKKLEAAKGELESTVAQFNGEIEKMKKAHEGTMENAKGRFEKALAKEKLSAKDKAKKVAEFDKKFKAKEKEFADKLAGKEKEYADKLGGLETELAKAKERIEAKKKLAQKIKSNLKKAGVDANINMKTGDVVISFNKEYFDTGSAALKPKMRTVLKKFMPLYSKSLFSDPKIADKIKSVEFIGFASPTYRGRYVDPQSLRPEDRKAAQYNLQLSIDRAKSIFNHVYDTQKMNFNNQKKLYSLTKVTGRSFFAENAPERNVATGMSQKDFCKKFDCQKSQRVIIKFNLEE